MTSRNRAAGNGDRDWLVNAWEWAGEMAAVNEGALRVSLTPTNRRGVWKVVSALVNVVDGRFAGVICKVEGEWPNSQHSTLCAYINMQCMQLDALSAQDMLASGATVASPD